MTWPKSIMALCALATLVPTSALAADWPPEGGRVIDRIVAIVNREPITAFELARAARPYMARLAEAGITDLAEEMKKRRSEVLDSLVDDILIYAEARKMKLDVSPEQVAAQVERVKEANGWDDDDLGEAITALGFESISDYRQHAKREMVKNQAIGYRVSSRIKIDASEIERIYRDQYAKGVERRRAAHILIKLADLATTKQIEEAHAKLVDIRNRALAGEATFEELARKHSQDTNAPAGGDLGWFSRGTFPEALEEVAFDLQVDGVSQPVRTDFGLHLVKLTGSKTESSVDEEAKEGLMREIRTRLRAKELERLYKEWVRDLRKDAFIELKPV